MLHQNLSVVLFIAFRRTLLSLLGIAVLLAVLVMTEAPWWVRMLIGTTYVAVLGLLLSRLRTQLPRGVSRWGRGLVQQSSIRERFSMALVVALAVDVGVLAFASSSVAMGGAGVLFIVVRGVVVGSVIMWILGRLGLWKQSS